MNNPATEALKEIEKESHFTNQIKKTMSPESQEDKDGYQKDGE
ncbi:MAG: hypothetical protein ACTSQA_00030 [Candidatus Heimdallarchaeaceae archaeon]